MSVYRRMDIEEWKVDIEVSEVEIEVPGVDIENPEAGWPPYYGHIFGLC